MTDKPRILVVDDEPVVRESIRDWFSMDEYPIEMAASGPEAIERLNETRWDILLTDVKMPGMDGLELQQRARKIDPELTVIIMTAYASVDSAMQAIKEGAYDYVTKPLDPEDLEQIINRACEHRKLVQENEELKRRVGSASGGADGAAEGPSESPQTGGLSLAEVEKQYIRNVLREVSGDVSRAAKALEVDEATLGEMLRKHGLEASPK
jgi:DNA-binding NtrC family response regulator